MYKKAIFYLITKKQTGNKQIVLNLRSNSLKNLFYP